MQSDVHIMRSNVVIPGLLLLSATIGGAALLHHLEPKTAVAAPTVKVPAAAQAVRPKIATGEAARSARGNLAIYIPPEVAILQEGSSSTPTFDLVVHFHGVAKNQETNIDEAKLSAVVVSVNEGIASESYGKAWSAPNAIDKVIKFAEEQMGKRESGAKVGRIALSSWSAGGASVKNILANEPADSNRIDAVILADGVFSFWEDQKKQIVKREPLDPIINFGKKAVNGEKLMVITHTAIPTDYPNVEACTKVVLDNLDLAKGEPLPATQLSGGAPTYAVDRGGFHVRGVDGKGPEDHIAQIRALDDAYSELRRRWYP